MGAMIFAAAAVGPLRCQLVRLAGQDVQGRYRWQVDGQDLLADDQPVCGSHYLEAIQAAWAVWGDDFQLDRSVQADLSEGIAMLSNQ